MHCNSRRDFYCFFLQIFQGYSSFLLRDLPFDAIQFCIYEQLRIGYKLAVSTPFSPPFSLFDCVIMAVSQGCLYKIFQDISKATFTIYFVHHLMPNGAMYFCTIIGYLSLRKILIEQN